MKKIKHYFLSCLLVILSLQAAGVSANDRNAVNIINIYFAAYLGQQGLVNFASLAGFAQYQYNSWVLPQSNLPDNLHNMYASHLDIPGSVPPLAPDFIAAVNYYHGQANCYDYACNVMPGITRPGRIHNANLDTHMEGQDFDLENILALAMSDGLTLHSTPGSYPVYFRASAGFRDLHWYRRGNNGLWTHTLGAGAPVIATDASGNPIINPLLANHDYSRFEIMPVFELGSDDESDIEADGTTGQNYSIRGCFLWVPPTLRAPRIWFFQPPPDDTCGSFSSFLGPRDGGPPPGSGGQEGFGGSLMGIEN
jgi:hypothetical protein